VARIERRGEKLLVNIGRPLVVVMREARLLICGNGHVIKLVDEFVEGGLGEVIALIVRIHSSRCRNTR